MKTTEKKIQDAFSKYGMDFPEGRVRKEMNENKEVVEKNFYYRTGNKVPSKIYFVQEMLERFFGEGYDSESLKKDVFLEKLGISEEWGSLPERFIHRMQFEFSAVENKIRLINENQWLLPEWLKFTIQEESNFLNEMLGEEKLAEMNVKQAFRIDLEGIQLEKERELKRTYSEFCKEINENPVFQKLTKRLNELLIEEYKRVYKIENLLGFVNQCEIIG